MSVAFHGTNWTRTCKQYLTGQWEYTKVYMCITLTDIACYCVQAVIELQRVLPKARIMYVSATGATDPEVHLC